MQGAATLLLLLPLLLSALPAPSHGWGVDGHLMVCQIAQGRLSDAAAAAVKDLLPSYAGGNLSSLCSWADDVKFRYHWSSALHYIDTPDGLCSYSYDRDCKDEEGVMGRCVAGAINNYTSQLLSYGKSASPKSMALTPAHCPTDRRPLPRRARVAPPPPTLLSLSSPLPRPCLTAISRRPLRRHPRCLRLCRLSRRRRHASLPPPVLLPSKFGGLWRAPKPRTLTPIPNTNPSETSPELGKELAGVGEEEQRRNHDNLTQALLFLSHFIGDIHQPLHVGFTSDRGGNTIDVHWYRRRTVLHHVWDASIIQTADDDFYGDDMADFIDTLTKNITGEWSKQVPSWEECGRNQTACPDIYATESITAACNWAYKGVQEDSTLQDAYFSSRLPVVNLRLAQGGVRLAATLNRIFG